MNVIALQALWGNYTSAMDDLGGFNSSVPVYVASGLLTYMSPEGVELLPASPTPAMAPGLVQNHDPALV